MKDIATLAMRLVCGLFLMASAMAEPPVPAQGGAFAKKAYQPQPQPQFAALRDKLPAPVFGENPEWVTMYWKAWELAFRNFHEPAAGSGYVSQFIDAAFNQNIFLWDTCFMTLFCNYGHPLVPGIGSLDNFYAKQYDDGEICREFTREADEGQEGYEGQEGFDRQAGPATGFPNGPHPESKFIGSRRIHTSFGPSQRKLTIS